MAGCRPQACAESPQQIASQEVLWPCSLELGLIHTKFDAVIKFDTDFGDHKFLARLTFGCQINLWWKSDVLKTAAARKRRVSLKISV